MRRTGVWVSVSRNSFFHKILSEFLQPFRYVGIIRVSPYLFVILIFIWFWDFGWFVQQLFWCFRRIRVSPYLSVHTFTWHDCWMVIRPWIRVSPYVSIHTFAWHDCWRMIWMINLGWRCHGCWRGKVGGRTRGQAWNHDRNEVHRIALYSNPVFNEVWFLTVDPFLRISVFIAQLSER